MNWLVVLVPILLVAVFFFLTNKKKSSPKLETKNEDKNLAEKSETQTAVVETKVEVKSEPEIVKVPAKKEIETPKISFAERLKLGLSRSRNEVWGKLSNIFSGNALDEEKAEALEELLYGADIGPKAVQELMDEVNKKAKEGNFSEKDFKDFLFTFLKSKMANIQTTTDQDLYRFDESKKGQTKVIMVVGVNGAGKTTTIGKLATKLRAEGANVVVGACDTFRAAAVDQLQVWCDRAGATMIRAKEGANPSGVGYDALQTAINMKADYCILDTAGRLHTKENLMDELTKSKVVLQKLDPTAPHQTLLVIDAITGQNALRQAEEFNKALNLTGLIFTKCDGSSKAGSAVSIVEALKVPIVYIGVGESAEDLDVFNLDDYLHALLGI